MSATYVHTEPAYGIGPMLLKSALKMKLYEKYSLDRQSCISESVNILQKISVLQVDFYESFLKFQGNLLNNCFLVFIPVIVILHTVSSYKTHS